MHVYMYITQHVYLCALIIHRHMAVGTGGQGGGQLPPPPNILPTKKI